MTIFEYDDYRSFIRFQLKSHALVRGYQTQLAKAAKCQTSFFSQVLAGKMELSYDHAADLCYFWKLESSDSEYFILLVSKARSSSPNLKRNIEGRLRKIKEDRLNVTQYLGQGTLANLESEAYYYSAWYWKAIHILVGVPSLNTAEKISTRLNLPFSLVQEILRLLEKMKLIAREKGEWKVMRGTIHLPQNSPMNFTNHFNWRYRALDNLQKRDSDALHYSSVFSLNYDDVNRIKEVLLEAIKESRQVISKSKQQDAFCMNLDLFLV